MPIGKRLMHILFWVFIILLFTRMPLDYDLWFHLAVGKYIWMTHSIPHTDLFSFSAPHYPYAYHSWGTELLLYTAFTKFGLWGVSLFYAVVSAVGLFIVGDTLKKRVANKPFLIASLILSAPVYAYIVYTRTQTVSFFFLCLMYWVYEKSKSNLKYLWLVPVAMACWANMHGGFALGLLFIAGLTLVSILEQLRKPTAGRPIVTCCAVLLAGALATLINPYGIHLHLQLARMALDPTIGALNTDWAPLFFRQLDSFTLGCVLLVAIIGVMITKRVTLVKKAALLIWFAASVYSRRYVLTLSVLLFPDLIVVMAYQFQVFRKKYLSDRILSLPIYVAVIALGIMLITNVPVQLNNLFQVQHNPEAYASMEKTVRFPYKAVMYMKTHAAGKRLLNDINWGGYLIWNFPNTRFFADGRMGEFYINNESFIHIYWDIITMQGDWKSRFSSYAFDSVLAPVTPPWPIVSWLKHQPDWRVVYEDDLSVLLMKKTE